MIKLYNHGIEQSVLSTLMGSDKAFDSVNGLHVDLFIDTRHKTVFECIERLKQMGKGCDVMLVAEWLESRKMMMVAGGESYLVEMMANSVFSMLNLQSYIDLLSDLYLRRLAVESLKTATDRITHAADTAAQDTINQAVRELITAGQAHSKKQSAIGLTELMRETVDEYTRTEEQKAVSGFVELDNLIGGFGRRELIIIGGRPAMGKTTFAMNAIYNAASHAELPWLVIELEMPRVQLGQRLQAAVGSIPLGVIKSKQLDGDQLARYGHATQQISKVPLNINDQSSQTLADVRAQANALYRQHGKLGGVMIDHLGLMGGIDANNKNNSIGEITIGLKNLAKDLDCPIILLSQLNRSLESRPNKRPTMADLRDSGSIEQDADIVLFVYRDEVYHPESNEKGLAEIIVGKQRNGALGTVKLQFRGEYSRFDNLMGGYSNDE